MQLYFSSLGEEANSILLNHVVQLTPFTFRAYKTSKISTKLIFYSSKLSGLIWSIEDKLAAERSQEG